jgi:TorA maturation chaperone TorD
MAMMELFRALGTLAEPPERAGVERLAAVLELGPVPATSEYTELFVFQLPPYASIYLGAEGMIGGEARDRVAGFWRALNQTPREEPDHLATMLGLYSRLAELEAREEEGPARARWLAARKAFLWEHLMSWLPTYLEKSSQLANSFYRRWGMILAAALREEVNAVGIQETLSLHLREAPSLVDPRLGSIEGFLQSLLAPVRSGMILTRADLARANLALDAGVPARERKLMLRLLLETDAAGTLVWLAQEAEDWSRIHRARRNPEGGVAEWWENRALHSAALLRELRDEAGLVEEG